MLVTGILLLAFGVSFFFFDTVSLFHKDKVVNLGTREMKTRSQTAWVPQAVAFGCIAAGLALILLA